MGKKAGTSLISVEELERQLSSIARPSALAQAAAEPVFSSSNIIRATNAREFKFGDNVLGRPLNIVILAAVHFQAYYDQAYDPENKTPPVCFALAPTEVELIPHETSPDKQHDGPCAMCRQNKPGSGEQGGYTRACSGRRRLAILSLDDKQPDPTIFSIEISAGGLREYSLWVKNLTTVEGIPTYLAAASLDFFTTPKDTWYLKPAYTGRLARIRPDWLTPGKGVKIGSEGWLDATVIGTKVRQVIESKMLLAPPSLVKPDKVTKGKTKAKPVTGKERVSVKDAKARRKAS